MLCATTRTPIQWKIVLLVECNEKKSNTTDFYSTKQHIIHTRTRPNSSKLCAKLSSSSPLCLIQSDTYAYIHRRCQHIPIHAKQVSKAPIWEIPIVVVVVAVYIFSIHTAKSTSDSCFRSICEERATKMFKLYRIKVYCVDYYYNEIMLFHIE